MKEEENTNPIDYLKSTITNLDLFALIYEINELVQEGFISNIYEINSEEKNLLLKCRTKTGNRKIIIDTAHRINITQFDYPTPQFPSQFITSLRKFLKGRRINRVYQYKLDRVLIFEIGSNEGNPWKFIIEFFAGGNYILVDGENRVLVAQHYKKFRNREILPKHEYSFPVSRGIDIFNLSDSLFRETISGKSGQIVRVLAKNFSIGGYIAEEICERANIPKIENIKSLSEDQIGQLFTEIQSIIEKVKNFDFKPQLIKDSTGKSIGFEPFELKLLENYASVKTQNFNDAVDQFYSSIDQKMLFSGDVEKSKSKLTKTEKILEQQLQKIEESKEIREESLEHGHLIYQYLLQIDNLISMIMKQKKDEDLSWKEIHAALLKGKKMNIPECIIYDRILPKEVKIQIDLEGHKFKLDLRKNAVENAEMIYSKAKKAKKKIVGAQKAIKITKEKIEKQQETHEQIAAQKNILLKRPKQKWYEKYRWFISSDDFLIVGGRDASSNEKIFSSHMNNNDLFFHTDVRGASVCIIKNDENKEIPLTTIKETGQFASCYSSAWKQGWGNADIYYVHPNQVSKTPKSGEYLKKGSFVINGKKNYITKPFLELCLGIKLIQTNQPHSEEEIDDKSMIEEPGAETEEKTIYFPKVIAGPESAIKKQTSIYVKIRPNKGGKKVSDLAKEILNHLNKRADKNQKPWVRLTSLNDLIRSIPPGNADLVKK